MKITSWTALLVAALPLAQAHDQSPMNDDWASRHMAGESLVSEQEHHINVFDAGSFFNLHDYDSSGSWTADDIMKTYGLRDVSTAHLSADQKQAVVDKVLQLYDKDQSGSVSFAEFTVADAHGVKLPDFGYGPGHHGDDEYEYEIHHFEKYHDENTKEEDLVHPEDIAHFKHHDEMEDRAELQARMDRMPIVEENIPAKFRRPQ